MNAVIITIAAFAVALRHTQKNRCDQLGCWPSAWIVPRSMRFNQWSQFAALPKPDRARALIALVLVVNAAISWGLLKDASEIALMWTAPSVAALVVLLTRKGLDGAKLAQVVAWGFVVVGTIFGAFYLIFSADQSASDRILGCAFIGTLLALQMTILAAIRWGRSDGTLLQAFARFMGILAVLAPMLILGYLFG